MAGLAAGRSAAYPPVIFDYYVVKYAFGSPDYSWHPQGPYRSSTACRKYRADVERMAQKMRTMVKGEEYRVNRYAQGTILPWNPIHKFPVKEVPTDS